MDKDVNGGGRPYMEEALRWRKMEDGIRWKVFFNEGPFEEDPIIFGGSGFYLRKKLDPKLIWLGKLYSNWCLTLKI